MPTYPTFVEDVHLACELTGLTLGRLAEALGVSRMTLNRWLRAPESVSRENLEAFYGFAFGQRVRLNLIREQLFTEDARAQGLIPLFHGSKAGIDGPLTLAASRADNDFGPGFYCGDRMEQAAMIVARFPESALYHVALDPAGLATHTFAVNRDWMLAVAYHRGRLDAYRAAPEVARIVSAVQAADLVVAPIADNRMFALIDSFIDGEITDIQCQHSLSATNLGLQYVLRTPAALAAVTFLEPQFLCTAEKRFYVRRQQEANDTGLDKVKAAKRQFRGQGRYIDELFAGEAANGAAAADGAEVRP